MLMQFREYVTVDRQVLDFFGLQNHEYDIRNMTMHQCNLTVAYLFLEKTVKWGGHELAPLDRKLCVATGKSKKRFKSCHAVGESVLSV